MAAGVDLILSHHLLLLHRHISILFLFLFMVCYREIERKEKLTFPAEDPWPQYVPPYDPNAPPPVLGFDPAAPVYDNSGYLPPYK
jgi:hypothetical protein